MTLRSSPKRCTQIVGSEPWREVNGETFTQWDRWLLRLAVEETQGFSTVAGLLEQNRSARAEFGRRDVDAKLGRIADLAARLASLGIRPCELLGDPDTEDQDLLREAKSKLFAQ